MALLGLVETRLWTSPHNPVGLRVYKACIGHTLSSPVLLCKLLLFVILHVSSTNVWESAPSGKCNI